MQPAQRPGRLLVSGFASIVNLIVTLATLLVLADRPGEVSGIVLIDLSASPATWPAPPTRDPQDRVLRHIVFEIRSGSRSATSCDWILNQDSAE